MDSLLEPRIGVLQLVVMAAALFVIHEVSFRFARRRRDTAHEAKRSQADVAVASLLAVLGLMLAFSFDIGAERFEQRRALVLDEANAIATTYLRAEMLPAPSGQRVQELLREYVRVRSAVQSGADLERKLRESEALQDQLWANAVAAARATPDSPITALFVASLNQVIDLHESRVTVGLYQRIPPAVFASLFLIAMLSIGVVGARAGLDGSRAVGAAASLVGAIICVMALIASLDDPASHLFGITKHAMADTQRMMMEHPVTSASRP